MDAFTLLDIEGAINGNMKPRVPNVEVEITRGCRITLEWDQTFERYVISFSKLKSEEQSCFATKVNIMHIQRVQDKLNALVKYREDNCLNQYIRKE